jgi:hypothetical protein
MLKHKYQIRPKLVFWLVSGAILLSAVFFCIRMHYRNGFRDRFFHGRLDSPVVNLRIWGQRRSLELADDESLAFLNSRIAHITPHYEIALMYKVAVTTADDRQTEFELYVTKTELLFQTPGDDLLFEGYPNDPPIYVVDITDAPVALQKAIEFLLTGAARVEPSTRPPTTIPVR